MTLALGHGNDYVPSLVAKVSLLLCAVAILRFRIPALIVAVVAALFLMFAFLASVNTIHLPGLPEGPSYLLEIGGALVVLFAALAAFGKTDTGEDA